MNITAVKATLKSLIDANGSTLVTGLTAQGQARVIRHLTTTVLTPAKQYFFVAIHHEESTEHTRIHTANISVPTARTAEYNMLIHVEDYAVSVAGEDELYETAQSNFDRFVDRIVKLIKDQTWIGTSPRYKLIGSVDPVADRRVLRSDSLQAWYDEAEAYHAMLTSQIRFTLIDECVDDTALYT